MIDCIINGKAGSDSAGSSASRIPELFREQGSQAELLLAQSGDHIASLARELVSAGRPLVVAAGGDGTVSTIAAALAGTPTSLGVLPLGTLNHFAKDLGIPLALEDAVDTVLRGTTVQVDVGEVNGHTFVNNSSLGLYPLIVQERSRHEARGYGKWAAFVRAGYEVMRRVPRFSVAIEASDHFQTRDRTPFVFVGNSRYETAGWRIGERNRLDTGKLWVCRAPDAGRMRLIRLAIRAALGRTAPGELAVLEAKELWVHPKRGGKFKVANDGELVSMQSPLHYKVRPGALRVVVPRRAS